MANYFYTIPMQEVDGNLLATCYQLPRGIVIVHKLTRSIYRRDRGLRDTGV
jgi:hypothetical protein